MFYGFLPSGVSDFVGLVGDFCGGELSRAMHNPLKCSEMYRYLGLERTKEPGSLMILTSHDLPPLFLLEFPTVLRQSGVHA